MSPGRIHQVSVSRGGVPKRSLPVAEVTTSGIVGDRQAQVGIHGGPYRALCLFPLELIERLRGEGHPIAPGGVGENVTTAELEWDEMQPGRRLRLGREARIELTAFAGPCQTISANFADGYFNRINERIAPGSSRVYAKVLVPGMIRPGDPIEVEELVQARYGPADLRIDGIGQLAIRVSDVERSLAYYRDTLGLQLDESAPSAGAASFSVGHVDLQLQDAGYAGIGPMPAGTVYFAVGDIDAASRALAARGISFEAGPLLESRRDGLDTWIAYFRDPDGNRLALVQERTHG